MSDFIHNFSEKLETLGKVLVEQEKPLGLFSEFTQTIDPKVNSIELAGSALVEQYEVKEEEGKGNDALNYHSPNFDVKKYITATTKGVASSVPFKRIEELATSEEQVSALQVSLVQNLYKSQSLYRYADVSKALKDFIKEGKIKNPAICKILDSDYNFLTAVNLYYDLLQVPTKNLTVYQPTKNVRYNQAEDIVLITSPEQLEKIKKIERDNLGMLEETFKKVNIIKVDQEFLGKTENNKDVVAYILPKSALMIFENSRIGTQENNKYEFLNYFLNTNRTIVVNPFQPVIQFTSR